MTFQGLQLASGGLAGALERRGLGAQLLGTQEALYGEVLGAGALAVGVRDPLQPEARLPVRVAAQPSALLLDHGVEAAAQPVGVGKEASDEAPDQVFRLEGAIVAGVRAALLVAVAPVSLAAVVGRAL